MNKKEVLEIRKQFTPENCTITRICGCYVDHEKEKKMEMKKAFLSMPEEEAFKYFDIFRHTLSGTVGKNLMTMEFPLDQELEGGAQELLLRLRDTKLTDDLLLEEFYDKVIENYEFAENYYIILIHAAYDVPGKSSDNMEMFDASDTVYEHIMCSVCPVKMTKPALCYYVLGNITPLTAKDQKTTFQSLVSDTLGEDCDYDTVRNIHDNLNELMEEAKESPDPLELSRPDVKHLLERSGVPEEKMEHFDKNFEEAVGEKNTLLASNIASVKTFQIETPDIVVKVNPERSDLVETREIDGRRCLVIAIDDHLEVNGIEVR